MRTTFTKSPKKMTILSIILTYTIKIMTLLNLTKFLQFLFLLFLGLVVNQTHLQAQNTDTLARTSTDTPDFLEVMDEIVVDVMVDLAMGRLDAEAENTFEVETQKRLFAIYTQAEIEAMVSNLPKDSFMKPPSRIENYKNLIAYHKTIFLPQTGKIRARLKDNLTLEDQFTLVNIRKNYQRDLKEHFTKKRSQLPVPQVPPSVRDEARRTEIDLTLQYHSMVPMFLTHLTQTEWYRNLLLLASNMPALSAEEQQLLASLREERYRLFFAGLGRMMTNMAVVGNPGNRKSEDLIELLLME